MCRKLEVIGEFRLYLNPHLWHFELTFRPVSIAVFFDLPDMRTQGFQRCRNLIRELIFPQGRSLRCLYEELRKDACKKLSANVAIGARLITTKVIWIAVFILTFLTVSGSCLASDLNILVSVADQKLLVFQDGEEKERFTISTSRFGTGDRWGSYATPLGAMEIADKIGDSAKEGTVFKQRQPTGEVLRPNAPGRDPIVTRILWLRGLEPKNANAFPRFIYIHGTPEERLLGTPVSWGCVRMRSKDVVKLFEMVDIGTRVEILNKPVKTLLKEHIVHSPLAQLLRD